jgi:hypothetical protein
MKAMVAASLESKNEGTVVRLIPLRGRVSVACKRLRGAQQLLFEDLGVPFASLK